MNGKSEIRMAMVGCGEISHTHAEAATNVEGVRFVSCCDVAETKAREWMEKYGCDSWYGSFETLLAGEQIDAVVLSTWPIQHLEQIELSLKHGVKNILCEKSLTLSGQDAAKVWHLVQENGAFLMEACKYRHHPAIKKIESILASGEVGRIDNISATFSNFEPEETATGTDRNWRYRRECGGGVTHDWMSYLVNGANHFSGSAPKRVFATGTVSAQYDIITRLYGMIEYENGITANISSSKDASFSQALEISCSKGILSLPVSWGIFGNVTLTRRHRMQEWPYILTDSYEIEHKDSFALQLRNFAEVIRGEAQPVLPLSQSVINVHTIEALAASVFEKRIVEIQLPDMSVS
ncbi:MAG TPA: Gfo/Idh/MocA family oxidoreductase [Spirochaetota bacterium]